MSGLDGGPDRAAILARRALFLGSALAGLVPAAGAKAQIAVPFEPGTDEPPRPFGRRALPEMVAAAVARMKHALERIEKDDAAIEDVARAYELHPHPKMAEGAMRVFLAGRDPDRAHRLGVRHRRCLGEVERVDALVAEIERTTARIEVDSNLSPRDELLLDEKPFDLERARRGVRVPPASR